MARITRVGVAIVGRMVQQKKEKLGMVGIFNRGKSMFALASVLFLTACSSGFDTDIGGIFSKSKPPPPCPKVAVLPNADSITIFREGPGRDLVDVLYEGVIAPVSGECLYENDETEILVELILRIGSVKGPAAQSPVQEYPFFVAIADKKKRILKKKILLSPIEIPEGRRRGAVQEEIVHRIPLPSGLDGRDYTIILGFQLTEEQFNYNRRVAN